MAELVAFFQTALTATGTTIMIYYSFDRSEFDSGKVDPGALHLEMVSRFGDADFSHIEQRGDDVRVYCRNIKAFGLVRQVVFAHRSTAVPFDPRRAGRASPRRGVVKHG